MQSLTSSCQSTCNDTPPPTTGGCGTVAVPKSYTVHVCNSATDCSGTNPYCCNFGLSQYAWCATLAESAYATGCY
jgi:hypothetical protein